MDNIPLEIKKTNSMQDKICLRKLKNITINKKYFLIENWNNVDLNTSTNFFFKQKHLLYNITFFHCIAVYFM